MDLTFRFIDDSGSPSGVFDTVSSGETAEIYRTTFGGIHRIMMNGMVCDGDFMIKHQVRTWVVVLIDETGGCSLNVTGEAPYE